MFQGSSWQELCDYFCDYGFRAYFSAQDDEEKLRGLKGFISGKLRYWLDDSRRQVRVACDYFLKALVKRCGNEYFEEIVAMEDEEYISKFLEVLENMDELC